MIIGYKGKRTVLSVIIAFCIVAVGVSFSAEPTFAMSKSAFKKTKIKSVKVKSVDYNTVQVSWKRLSGANGYTVYVSKTKYGKYHAVVDVDKGSAKKTKVTNCVTGKKYFFKVRAYKYFGTKKVETAAGKAVSGKAVLTKPALSVKSGGGAWIQTSWKTCAGAAGYQIYRATKKTGKYKKIATVKGDAISYTDTTCKVKKTYFYKVRAYCKVKGKTKYSSYSAIKKRTTPPKNGNASISISFNSAAASGLQGKRVIFLGSSVTLGKYSGKESFVDMLQKHVGLASEKYAVNGTTLVDRGEYSYIARLKQIPTDTEVPADAFVCQLSSNDARIGRLSTIGSVPAREAMEAPVEETALDTSTLSGAVAYVAAYSNQKFDCPAVFYVLPSFKNTKTFSGDHYARMRKALYDVKIQWDGHSDNQTGDHILILDLWDNAILKNASTSTRLYYMADSVHPTKAGYYKIYMPAFEKFLPIAWAEMAEEPADPEEPAADPGENPVTDPTAGSNPDTNGDLVQNSDLESEDNASNPVTNAGESLAEGN